ncbi:MAG: glycoside hydrolase family 3 C-terminal domain-containing protein [Clostridia bacterium]|nr:glycoside hydrolase family 3 C-terminal domain-containing protein [Clostridia bacterium]
MGKKGKMAGEVQLSAEKKEKIAVMTAEEAVGTMTFGEKIRLCSGKNCWETKDYPALGLPSVFMSDGPNGLRKQEATGDMLGINRSVPSTCFPASSLSACSWDPELMSEMGAAIGEEARKEKVSMVLGPGLNIKRNPLCGRNFEYLSEDPYLAGKMAAGYIQGMQSKGVKSCVKHFAANSQEYKRFSSDSVMDERTMREIYLAGFETAVREGKPGAVMSAYNMLNGEHCSCSKVLLNDILRKDWGFEGIVVTDWGAIFDRVEGFRAGCDLSMPGGNAFMEPEVAKAVKEGRLDEADVTRCAERVYRFVREAEKTSPEPCDYEAHHEIARRVATESAVLLKNDGILPLRDADGVVIIGDMAREPRYQGTGSSHINPVNLVSMTDIMPDAPFAPGYDRKGNTTDELVAEAVKLAEGAKKVILVCGLPYNFEAEGFDRDDMKMPEGYLRVLDAVTAVNQNVVVVLICGCAVEVPWDEKVRAILYAGLPGEAGVKAVYDLLFGIKNPSGKLAESWPVKYGDCVTAPYYGEKDAHYMEGLYVGYRYYDSANVPVKYPFGYGLSYTTFEYGEMVCDEKRVSVKVTNTGSVSGGEVVQLYVSAKDSPLYRPEKELKGFKKVWLEPGESAEVTFELDDRSFAVWDGGWKVLKGTYSLKVGSSSRDIRCEAEIELAGETVETPSWQTGSWYETLKGLPSKSEWERMLGRSVTPAPVKRGKYTMNNTVIEMKKTSLIMKIMYMVMIRMFTKQCCEGKKPDFAVPEFRMMVASGADSNISCMVVNSGFKNYVIQGMLEIANGHPFKGFALMMKKLRDPE